tara:strand:- start:36 stop:446 length:411 start_codon:yes stop_codon:yes gene_type:complete
MFFLEKNKNNNDNFIKIAALLIHAAKIDQDYTNLEKKIIEQTIVDFGAKENDLEFIMKKANEIEENSNQILDFTKEVKSLENEKKIKIIETLWKIIYSNKDADIFETNLMRRLGGLLYIDNKTLGDIKEKIKKNIL